MIPNILGTRYFCVGKGLKYSLLLTCLSLLHSGALLPGAGLQDDLALLVQHLPALLPQQGPADVPAERRVTLVPGDHLLALLLDLLVQDVNTDGSEDGLIDHPALGLHLQGLAGGAVSLRDGDVD